MTYAARSGSIGPSRSASFVERLAAQELHHHEEIGLVAEQLEDGGDLRMIEAREDCGFGAEPRHDLAVGEVRVQRLDRDIAAQRLVDRFVDDTCPASSKLADDSILPDGPADHQSLPLGG
jgi:hypothetical protein